MTRLLDLDRTTGADLRELAALADERAERDRLRLIADIDALGALRDPEHPSRLDWIAAQALDGDEVAREAIALLARLDEAVRRA